MVYPLTTTANSPKVTYEVTYGVGIELMPICVRVFVVVVYIVIAIAIGMDAYYTKMS